MQARPSSSRNAPVGIATHGYSKQGTQEMTFRQQQNASVTTAISVFLSVPCKSKDTVPNALRFEFKERLNLGGSIQTAFRGSPCLRGDFHVYREHV